MRTYYLKLQFGTMNKEDEKEFLNGYNNIHLISYKTKIVKIEAKNIDQAEKKANKYFTLIN